MSRIECLECIDGKNSHCESCNVYHISNHFQEYLDAYENYDRLKKIEENYDNLYDYIEYQQRIIDNLYEVNNGLHERHGRDWYLLVSNGIIGRKEE